MSIVERGRGFLNDIVNRAEQAPKIGETALGLISDAVIGLEALKSEITRVSRVAQESLKILEKARESLVNGEREKNVEEGQALQRQLDRLPCLLNDVDNALDKLLDQQCGVNTFTL